MRNASKYLFFVPSAAIAAIFVTGLAGCSGGDATAIGSAEKSVVALLKDPDSAKFSNEFIVRGVEDKDGFQPLATCGFVNAKNSFGGYTGASRFVVSQTEGHKIITFDSYATAIEDAKNRHAIIGGKHDPKPSVFEEVYWNTSCVDAQHPATYSGTNDD